MHFLPLFRGDNGVGFFELGEDGGLFPLELLLAFCFKSFFRIVTSLTFFATGIRVRGGAGSGFIDAVLGRFDVEFGEQAQGEECIEDGFVDVVVSSFEHFD